MKSEIARLLIFLFLGINVSGSYNATTEPKNEIYSAFDSASWAVTSDRLSPLLGLDKQHLYDEYINACDVALSKSQSSDHFDGICKSSDKQRMKMNHDQPSSVYNYTKNGYAKTRVPTDLFIMIKDFFNKNRHRAEIEWKKYNVYHNAWESPPTIVHLHSAPKSKDGSSLMLKIQDEIKPILEQWTGQRLAPVSTYGIRLYHNGSILAPHVDRMPLVTSAIIQVDQDVDEAWPLEVYGHDGTATNVTMEPGDMVLYESHSVIHGRPFPMIGNFFANCFIHFEPYESIDGKSLYDPKKDIPPYLKPGSTWEVNWKSDNPMGWKGNVKDDLRAAAGYGHTKKFERLALEYPEHIHYADSNGWTVIHEAVRGGQVEIIKFLLKHGVDKDLLTGAGMSPLALARRMLSKDHGVIEYFESIGAKNIAPERLRRRQQEL